MISDQNKEKSQSYNPSGESPLEKAKPVSAAPPPGTEGQENKLSETTLHNSGESDPPPRTFSALISGAHTGLQEDPSALSSGDPSASKFDKPAAEQVEQAEAQPASNSYRTAEISNATAAVSEATPAGQVRPKPAGQTSTDSLLQEILPAEKIKTETTAPAVKNPIKRSLQSGAPKGG